MKALILIAIVSAIYGCGTNVGGAAADTSTDVSDDSAVKVDNASSKSDVSVAAKYYATESELPTCDDTNARDLVYVKETTQFEYCDAVAGWTAIDLKGPKGDAGASSSMSVAAQYTCPASSDADATSDVNVHATGMEITKFSNGDYFVQCGDTYANTTFTYSDSSFKSAFFPSDSTAVKNGKVAAVPFYFSCIYSIAEKKALYHRSSTPEFNQTVACTQTYP